MAIAEMRRVAMIVTRTINNTVSTESSLLRDAAKTKNIESRADDVRALDSEVEILFLANVWLTAVSDLLVRFRSRSAVAAAASKVAAAVAAKMKNCVRGKTWPANTELTKAPGVVDWV